MCEEEGEESGDGGGWLDEGEEGGEESGVEGWLGGCWRG